MLPTIKVTDKMREAIAKEIEQYLYTHIYKPLLKAIYTETKERVKLNAIETPEAHLMMKIEKAEIRYEGETFTGKFDSQSSKAIKAMGGTWDSTKKVFRMSKGKLTPNIKIAISISKTKAKATNDAVKRTLDEIEAKTDKSIEEFDITPGLEKVISALQYQTITAMDAIGVKYTLTHGQKENIKAEYTTAMKKYIKSFHKEHTINLREAAEANAMQGYRQSALVDMIQHQYGVSRSKAEFLAKQETSLFMAAFRRNRFKEAGVEFYKWQSRKVYSGPHKVRKSHQELDGKIFQFGDPPISSPTGAKNEPGEDFGCLCIAVPITDRCIKVGQNWQIAK